MTTAVISISRNKQTRNTLAYYSSPSATEKKKFDMISTCPKYSLSFSGVVCHESPPTNSLPGAESDDGVDRPDVDPFWLSVSVPLDNPLRPSMLSLKRKDIFF